MCSKDIKMANTYTDINLNKMVFNKVTNEQYRSMLAAGTLNEDEFYITPAESADIPAIDSTTADMMLMNDGSTMYWTNDKFKIYEEIFNRIYDGRDLTTVYATEIANYSSAWAWIKARIDAGNYDGLFVGDYIPMTISSGTVGSSTIAAQTFQMQIAGIDTYKNCGDTELGHHIDFISRECIDTAITWNPNNNNNGTADETHPWLASQVYAWLNGVNNYSTNAYNSVAHGGDYSSGGILNLLPSTVSSLIVSKRMILDVRYSASGLLSYSTAWDWKDGGKLWLPQETEVYGQQVRSNLGYASGYWNPENGLSAPYPLFQQQARNRVKRNSSGSRWNWWLSSTESNNSGNACNVNNNGNANSNNCTNANGCPV